MGISTRVIALVDPHGDYHQKMLAAALALKQAGIDKMPEELAVYFDTDYACEVFANPDAACELSVKVFEYTNRQEGCIDYVVDVRDLPKGVTHIRFTNSW